MDEPIPRQRPLASLAFYWDRLKGHANGLTTFRNTASPRVIAHPFRYFLTHMLLAGWRKPKLAR
jgi:hypothetical protein